MTSLRYQCIACSSETTMVQDREDPSRFDVYPCRTCLERAVARTKREGLFTTQAGLVAIQRCVGATLAEIEKELR